MTGALLPNAHSALVHYSKVYDYLLNPNHAGNRGKAAFFLLFGFSSMYWQVLRDALRQHPQANSVAKVQPNPYGARYVVRCNLTSPDGRNPCIITIWVIDPSTNQPQFVTAYPGNRP